MKAMRGVLFVAFALLAGCSPPPQSSADPADRPVGTAPITVDEIVSAGLLGSTAYDVVQRLRPAFLIDHTAIRRSSQPILVSINGGELSNTNVLNSTPAAAVQEIRYFPTGQASARFGSRALGPVILVMLRTQPP